MQKLVVLKLDGDLFEGVRVTLEIGAEGDRAVTAVRGNLAPKPEIVTHYDRWQSTYRSLEDFRITPIGIRIGGSRTEQSDKCRKLGDELSQHLNSWLNSESFRPIKEKLLKQLTPDDAVRILIKTDDTWLRRLPWHLWDFFEDYSKAEIALSAPEYEKLPSSKIDTSKDKVKILAILGNSEGISIEEDRELLEKLPDAQTTFLLEPQRSQLSEQLWKQHWDILFFAGHSYSQEDGKTGSIVINKTDILTINDLRYALKQAARGGLQLAIFNSCDGLGLARQLEDLHIPQIIAMREPVPNKVAQEFLKNFLAKFAAGEHLYLAVRQSREMLHGIENEYPCAIWLPVLCQNPAVMPPSWQELRGWTKHNSAIGITTDSYSLVTPVANRDSTRSLSRQVQLSRRSLGVALLASVFITSLLLGSRWQGKLQTWELQAFDHLVQMLPVKGPDRRLLVVRVTATDIQAQPPQERGGGAASLSERTLDRLLKKLEEHQPRVIGLDIYRESYVSPSYKDLEASLRENSRLITICEGSSHNGHDSGISAPPEVPKDRIGFSDLVLDEDDIIRRHLLLMELNPPYTCKAKEVEAFSLKLALNYLKKKGITRQDGPQDEFLQVGSVVFNPLQLHIGGYHRADLDKDGNLITDMRGYQVMLKYLPYRNYLEDIAPTVTLNAVLNDQLAPEDVRDRIVLIGVDDGDRDQHSTPYTNKHQPLQKVSGVFIHAQMVSHILNAVLERQVLWAWRPWGDALWMWGWSLVGGVLAVRVRSLLLLGLAGGIAIGILYGFCFGFLTQSGWIPLIPSALTLLVTSISVAAYTAFQARRC